MHAKALVSDENQNFSYADVILSDPGPEHILIRALYSGVSIGTEFALIRNKISTWGQYPICTGYQGVGVIEYVGGKVEGFKVGDKIYYRDNREGIHLSDGQEVSAASGVHCSAAVVNPQTTHGLELLPEGIAEDAASLFVMPAVGLNGVDTANPRMGDVVAVYGAGWSDWELWLRVAIGAASSLPSTLSRTGWRSPKNWAQITSSTVPPKT